MLLGAGIALLFTAVCVMRWARPVEGQLSPRIRAGTMELAVTGLIFFTLFGGAILVISGLFGGG